ncbi:helix-turn-helix domain-containing protein [Saccharopolyspora shandongensis]|uniref:helix-turn-helix domain-containing protein n=1 Tax=Saccharopolyspora shandongensis TaxID=418495 RepID=UPI0033FBDC5B
MLQELGISELDERTYRLLVAEPSIDPHQLASRLGLSRPDLDEVVANLRELGLVKDHGVDEIRPVHPRIALIPLLADARAALRAKEQRVELASAALAELSTLGAQSSDAFGTEVEVNRGSAAAFGCMERIAATARERVQVLAASGPAPGVPDQDDYTAVVQLAISLAERGIPLRLIMLDSINYLTPLVEGARMMQQAGVEVRTSPVLPAWTIIVDHEYVVTAIDTADHTQGSLLVRTPGAVAAAGDLFRRCWQEATPLGGTEPEPVIGELTTAQHQLLVMVVNGSKDEAIARRFSVSTRTVRRMVTDLYEVAGVSSRIQLAFRAAKLG